MEPREGFKPPSGRLQCVRSVTELSRHMVEERNEIRDPLTRSLLDIPGMMAVLTHVLHWVNAPLSK